MNHLNVFRVVNQMICHKLHFETLEKEHRSTTCWWEDVSGIGWAEEHEPVVTSDFCVEAVAAVLIHLEGHVPLIRVMLSDIE